MRHLESLAAGIRLYAISIDSPERNAAMVERLSLPFPYLSDPDRSKAVFPFGFADEKDDRQISSPSRCPVAGCPQGGLPHSRRAADVRDALPRLLVSRPAGRGSLGHRPLADGGLLGHRPLADGGLLGHATP